MIRSLLLFSLSYGSNDRNYTRAGLDEISAVRLPETLQCRPAIPYGHLQQILIGLIKLNAYRETCGY